MLYVIGMTTSIELKFYFLMSYLSAQIVFWLFSIPTSFSLPKTELKRLFETGRIIDLFN